MRNCRIRHDLSDIIAIFGQHSPHDSPREARLSRVALHDIVEFAIEIAGNRVCMKQIARPPLIQRVAESGVTLTSQNLMMTVQDR